MKMRKGIAAICAAAFLLSGCSGSSGTVQTEPVETQPVETGPVRPQDDYYRYVNGELLEDSEFSYGHTVTADSNDDSAVREVLGDIIDEVVAGSGYAEGTEEYIIQNLFNAYVDYDFDNAGVPEDLDQLLHEINDAESLDELLAIDARVWSEYGVPNILSISIGISERRQCDAVLILNPQTEILGATLYDLGESYSPLDTIRDFSSCCLQAVGHDVEEADSIGTDLAYLALDLYDAADKEMLEQVDASYFELYTLDQVEQIFTNIDIEAYLTDLGIDLAYADEFGLYDASQLQVMNDILTDDNLPALKAWEIGRIAEVYSEFIYPGYDAFSDYVRISYDTPEEDARDLIMGTYGLFLDPIYVEQNYTEETDEALRDMCEDIREQYRVLISGADWLTEQTRQGLLNKLDKIVIVTGTDLERIDPSVASMLDFSSYYEFFKSYKQMYLSELNDLMSEPVDRRTIDMRMYTVNACYIPNLNSVTITVASASDPFFNINDDYYTNLGALGATIGHEMGHAFDSNCILYNEDGVYDPSWLAPEDIEALNARNEQAVRYFEDNFVIFGIYHVDGEQTLGENYADLGGLECIAGIPETNEQMQRMFEAYARSWCMKLVDESLINQIANDVHSPSWIRVNAMLSTLEAFYETYDVQEGDGMYIAPENRISRWY